MTHNAGTKVGKYEVDAIFGVTRLIYQETDSITELTMVKLAKCHSKPLLSSNSIFCRCSLK